MSGFKTNIGLEIHVQLKTESKMFCGCDNKADKVAPNTLVCPICMGFPGVLPMANKQAIEWTIKTALALNCKISPLTKFDRKHYFYPDLPKNYQISQYDLPISTNGWLEIESAGWRKKIRIKRVHLEEDAAKLVHKGKNSLIDFNRSGTPLMEIVSEPDISSPNEAKLFLRELRTILRYLSVSDANMEKGHLRCDANISINPKSEARNPKLGIPVEIKNMNSFRMVERALAFEEKRQAEILAKGGKIIRETRGWIDEKGITISQRSKEEASDYRYFPEPDLPAFEFSKALVKRLKEELPELPEEKRKKYEKNGLSQNEAEILAEDWRLSNYFEEVAKKTNPKKAASWILVELLGRLSAQNKTLEENLVKAEDLADLILKIEKGGISGKIAKEVFHEMFQSGKKPDDIIKRKGFKIVADEKELDKIIQNVIKENEKAASDYKDGKKSALQYLLGQVMQKTRGQADPKKTNKILIRRLAEPTGKAH